MSPLVPPLSPPFFKGLSLCGFLLLFLTRHCWRKLYYMRSIFFLTTLQICIKILTKYKEVCKLSALQQKPSFLHLELLPYFCSPPFYALISRFSFSLNFCQEVCFPVRCTPNPLFLSKPLIVSVFQEKMAKRKVLRNLKKKVLWDLPTHYPSRWVLQLR